ncbi:FtsW/RodA/SpoVE family cell cycle protein [bacterium]|nr:MAG: FtsW/RodA/SpoVE family cell cycle protein [bacterium]
MPWRLVRRAERSSGWQGSAGCCVWVCSCSSTFSAIPRTRRSAGSSWDRSRGFLALAGVALTERGKDLGTAAVLLAILGAMCVIAGVRWQTLVAWSLVMFVGITGLVMKEPYRVARITNHLHRWDPKVVDSEGFQSAQAEVGMASGGLTGVGLGRGRTKHIIPAPTTDYVNATIGEETGLVGMSAVLLLLGGIVARLLILAKRAQEKFPAYVLFGTASWLTIQTCVNVMMANATLPSIGIPVPFISSGGSSLIALWLAIGICQGVLRQSTVKVKEETAEAGADGRRYGRTRLSRA